MTYTDLAQQITLKKSCLCVGLDTDIHRIPKHLLDAENPIFEFNKAIIDATRDFCVAYKPNNAFYEAHGILGYKALKQTIEYIDDSHLIICDAKRGDIGNTCNMYAKAIFEDLGADAITLAPYMGRDSVEPFLKYDNKWSIVLAATSNKSSADFEFLSTEGAKLYEQVLAKSKTWGTHENMMYVVGATHPDVFTSIRKIVPEHFLLVPGIGAQGGDLTGTMKNGLNDHCGLLINSARGIIYAGSDQHFDEAAAESAKQLQQQMAAYL